MMDTYQHFCLLLWNQVRFQWFAMAELITRMTIHPSIGLESICSLSCPHKRLFYSNMVTTNSSFTLQLCFIAITTVLIFIWLSFENCLTMESRENNFMNWNSLLSIISVCFGHIPIAYYAINNVLMLTECFYMAYTLVWLQKSEIICHISEITYKIGNKYRLALYLYGKVYRRRRSVLQDILCESFEWFMSSQWWLSMYIYIYVGIYIIILLYNTLVFWVHDFYHLKSFRILQNVVSIMCSKNLDVANANDIQCTRQDALRCELSSLKFETRCYNSLVHNNPKYFCLLRQFMGDLYVYISFSKFIDNLNNHSKIGQVQAVALNIPPI